MYDVYIITGASKGIGHALANQLEKEGGKVLRLARTNPNQLINLIEVDLCDFLRTQSIVDEWIKDKIDNARSITLINNAGTVEPIGIVGEINLSQMKTALLLNVGAVIALTNHFVKITHGFKGVKRIMNISSGAGRKAYEGWGIYCATKAAIDHFSAVLMTEQSKLPNPVKITSIAPGIIDTDMQTVIRASTEENFPDIERFIEYKKQGLLSSPEETAAFLINYLHSTKMGTLTISDIRE